MHESGDLETTMKIRISEQENEINALTETIQKLTQDLNRLETENKTLETQKQELWTQVESKQKGVIDSLEKELREKEESF